MYCKPKHGKYVHCGINIFDEYIDTLVLYLPVGRSHQQIQQKDGLAFSDVQRLVSTFS